MTSPTRPAGLRGLLADLGLTDEEAAYLKLHERRYELLIEGVLACVAALPDRGRAPRILDVGPAAEAALLRRALPASIVNTLGYANRLSPPREGERHFDVDLNDAGDPEGLPEVPAHDVIVAAELIEHLAIAPRAIFERFAAWLEPGGWLIVQTPNALALHKRIRALAGRNPLGAAGDVGAPSHSAAHFREYTRGELAELAAATGFEFIRAETGNYFRPPGAARRAYDRVTERLPAGTRQGITAYLRRR